MYCLIAGESAIFLAFITAYVFYMGESIGGPTPRQVLTVPVVSTVCLLASSLTIHLALSSVRGGRSGRFCLFWFGTVALGAAFLAGIGREWAQLINQENFTMQTSAFGATYYSLIGLHASHVVAGLMALAVVLVLALWGRVKQEHADRCQLVSLDWHFVDVVWVVIFTVVYVVGRYS